MSTEPQIKAFYGIKATTGEVHTAILDAIEVHGGLACWELQILLDQCHKSMTGRLSELRKAGKIMDSGEERVNPEITTHTASQTVWVLGDDRDKVRADDIRKLRKLADRLGFGLIEPMEEA